MQNGLPRTLLSLVVFVAWTAITVFLGRLWHYGQGTETLDATVSNSLLPVFPVAITFLLTVILAFRWYDIGLNAPMPPRSLRLLWLPALYILGFVALSIAAGLPPLPVMLVTLANTLMVAVSEELACRGILYQGLRARLSVWPAILLATLLFGAVHLFNGIVTGDFVAAAFQAVTAFMTGIAFMGIRIRTRSIYPGIVLHGLWDFTLVTSAVGRYVATGHCRLKEPPCHPPASLCSQGRQEPARCRRRLPRSPPRKPR